METNIDLQRFLDAQRQDYQTALKEIKAGKKRSHWMWYIFPQVAGLGFSSTSVYYSIKSMEEASAFLNHPVLGANLREITKILLQLPERNARTILGSPDDMKLRSCMTLFAHVAGTEEVFKQVLAEFFEGQMDSKTLQILDAASRKS
jgi:uncharacterized protein (DUF1810 family)